MQEVNFEFRVATIFVVFCLKCWLKKVICLDFINVGSKHQKRKNLLDVAIFKKFAI